MLVNVVVATTGMRTGRMMTTTGTHMATGLDVTLTLILTTILPRPLLTLEAAGPRYLSTVAIRVTTDTAMRE